jgi:hypothetical protein
MGANTMGLRDWWNNRGRDLALFPQDENGDVLWGMHCAGDDLRRARDMDFFFIFPDKRAAEQFCISAEQQGFRVALTWFEEKLAWDATCSIHICPTHARVTQLENDLVQTARPLGGKGDGWGALAQ